MPKGQPCSCGAGSVECNYTDAWPRWLRALGGAPLKGSLKGFLKGSVRATEGFGGVPLKGS